jgi:GntR family transcriptional regulator
MGPPVATDSQLTTQQRGSVTDRVYADLLDRITDGRLPEGSRLPTERTLAEQLDVSRVTVRRAIARLRDERLIQSVQGAGTFVATSVLGETPNALMSFSRLAAARGLVAGSQPIGVTERPATIEEAEQMSMAPGTDVVAVDRIRTLDGIPVAISYSIVPSACAPGLARLDWSTASLFGELAAAGHAPVRADYSVEAQAADDSASTLLRMPVGQPVLVTRSTSYAANGRAVELALMTYRGDRYRFRSTLHV